MVGGHFSCSFFFSSHILKSHPWSLRHGSLFWQTSVVLELWAMISMQKVKSLSARSCQCDYHHCPFFTFHTKWTTHTTDDVSRINRFLFCVRTGTRLDSLTSQNQQMHISLYSFFLAITMARSVSDLPAYSVRTVTALGTGVQAFNHVAESNRNVLWHHSIITTIIPIYLLETG